MALSDLDRRILWVRAGGRCTLCKRYLLEGDLTTVEVPLGEGAHIVGAVDSEKSPRGKNPLPVCERDTVDNVMLACSACHNEADQLKAAKLGRGPGPRHHHHPPVPAGQAEMLSALAQAAAATGEHDRARRLLCEAEDLARAITAPYEKAAALSAVAQAAAATGEFDRAEDLATPSPPRTGRRRR